MKIACIMWNAKVASFAEAAAMLPSIEFSILSHKELGDIEGREEFLLWMANEADALLTYHSSGALWAEIESEVKAFAKTHPVISLGRGPEDWIWSNQATEIVTKAQEYFTHDGLGNTKLLIELCVLVFSGRSIEALPPPLHIPWDGIYCGTEKGVFDTYQKFLPWALEQKIFVPGWPVIGILFYRSAWLMGNTAHIDALIKALHERACNVIPVFSSTGAAELGGGARGHKKLFEDCFTDNGKTVIDAGFNLRGFFLGDGSMQGTEMLSKLGVPFLNGMIAYRKTEEEWRNDPQGVANSLTMLVCGAEFDGITEPLVIAAVERKRIAGVDVDFHVPIADRIEKAASRLAAWAKLSRKPKEERRIAFVLHNSPCASVEATVGGGAKLDTLESVARILRRMKDEGYSVEVPESGKSLIDEIMERKAISEFRWTSSAEIVAKGGTLDLVEGARYFPWFEELPVAIRDRMEDAWGKAPGEANDGIPATMLHDGKILVTGLRFGNAIVCVQPKRGCAEARCDGQVCKILHDPGVPPTHQYLATYRWIEREFGADCIVHVGTHGNLEFLPGKSVGLSDSCFSDICIGSMPHLYIYNADNPPEGVIAKRRGLATIVDHMQTVMLDSGLYGPLEEIEQLLGEWRKAKTGGEHARAHQAEHRIYALAGEARLLEELGDGKTLGPHSEIPFEDFAVALHEKMDLLKNSQLPKGMHIFGEAPAGSDRIEFIYSIMKYSAGKAFSMRMVELVLSGTESSCDDEKAPIEYIEKIRDINRRIDDSREMEALLDGFNGRHIPSGPSGLITRGRDDVLPTGRNFYSLDPKLVPSRSAFTVGKRLSDALVERFRKDHGRVPECVALYWMSNDIMWSDGEVLGQMLDLLGCEPVWDSAGRVNSFRVLPADALRRPRIDLSIRVSGITRDNFPCRVELLDEAIQAVASLDEPPDLNFVRKHVKNRLNEINAEPENSSAMREATYRIFAAQPGSFQAGVQLAVYASAWKTEKDLAEIYMQWNGYAYGKGVYGVPAPKQLHATLKTAELTYNKTASDESDLFGCCCYFGTHGGMSASARAASGHETPAYYGDTREPSNPAVRTLTEEINRVVRAKLLNPKWIEGMKAHGYKGAGDIAKRIGRVYGWDAAAGAVDDWVFDSLTDEFVLDEENRAWFQENNKWALEEIGRRMIEALERGLWNTSEERAENLRSAYLEVEGWMEDDLGEFSSEVQGGSIDVMSATEIPAWRTRLETSLDGITLFDRSNKE